MTERWHSIPGFEGVYEVSDAGRVRSLDRLIHRRTGAVENHRGRVLAQHKAGRGYHFVPLCKDGTRKLAYVHRLVAAAFLPTSDAPHVNHIDHDKSNNVATNLEWVTPSENQRHAVKAERFRRMRLSAEVQAAQQNAGRLNHEQTYA